MRNVLKIIVFNIFLITSIFGQDVNDIIGDVQDTYDEIDNFSAVFKRVETFKITGSQTETLGKIYISDGEKYRFESDGQVIVTDGENVWAYSARSNQVIIDKIKENSAALLPRDLLFKYPKKYYATLLKTEMTGKKKIFVIKLDPKEDTHGYVKSIKLWVEEDTWLIQKIEATDLRGNITAFEITKINTKTKIPASHFQYNPGPDTEVVDRR